MRRQLAALLLLALGRAASAVPASAPAAPASEDPPAEPPPWVLQVTADTVLADAEAVWAEGAVEVQLVGQTCAAKRLRLDRASRQLVLESGRCTDALGPVEFSRAELDLAGGAGVLFDARLTGRPGPLLVTADRVERLSPDRLRAEGAWVSLCACPKGPWSVEARQVELVLDDVARFRGGWIRVCERRVLPVPIGAVALADRRTGLLFPRVGWGRDGLILGQPVMARLGPSADLVAVPEWRQERGLRGVGEARLALAPDEGVTASGFGGWDTGRQQARGAVAVREGWAPGPLRTAVEGQWVSDEQVLFDYGDDFLARSAPWSESRAVVGAGALRVETARYQPLADAALQARPWSIVAARGATALGPLVADGVVRADGVGQAAGLAGGADAARVWSRAGLTAGAPVGPARLSARAEGRLVQWEGSTTALQGRAGAEALLDLWGDVGPLRHLAGLGVEAGLAEHVGPSQVRLPDERRAPRAYAGPVVESRWVSAAGAPVSARATAPWTPTGWRPQGRLQLQAGAWQAVAQADRRLQDGRLAWDDGALRVGAGVAHTGALLQGVAEASWQLPGPLSELRPGWRMQRDLADGSTLSQSALLSWRSRCDCLTALAGATWSVDRAVPDVLLRLQL